MTARRPARLLDLGHLAYEDAYAVQQRLVAERQAGAGLDTLVLVEHPHVITLGRRASARANVLARDMPVVEVERGGDVTYHGPGQLVGYPILALAAGSGGDAGERDLHRYLRAIENGIIGALADLGVCAQRREGAAYTGVWVGERKIASIGVAVRQWVTMHGFALNVSTDLGRFAAINPCGFSSSVMTSLAVVLGRAVTLDEVKPAVVRRMGEALGRDFAIAPGTTHPFA